MDGGAALAGGGTGATRGGGGGGGAMASGITASNTGSGVSHVGLVSAVGPSDWTAGARPPPEPPLSPEVEVPPEVLVSPEVAESPVVESPDVEESPLPESPVEVSPVLASPLVLASPDVLPVVDASPLPESPVELESPDEPASPDELDPVELDPVEESESPPPGWFVNTILGRPLSGTSKRLTPVISATTASAAPADRPTDARYIPTLPPGGLVATPSADPPSGSDPFSGRGVAAVAVSLPQS